MYANTISHSFVLSEFSNYSDFTKTMVVVCKTAATVTEQTTDRSTDRRKLLYCIVLKTCSFQLDNDNMEYQRRPTFDYLIQYPFEYARRPLVLIEFEPKSSWKLEFRFCMECRKNRINVKMQCMMEIEWERDRKRTRKILYLVEIIITLTYDNNTQRRHGASSSSLNKIDVATHFRKCYIQFCAYMF